MCRRSTIPAAVLAADRKVDRDAALRSCKRSAPERGRSRRLAVEHVHDDDARQLELLARPDGVVCTSTPMTAPAVISAPRHAQRGDRVAGEAASPGASIRLICGPPSVEIEEAKQIWAAARPRPSRGGRALLDVERLIARLESIASTIEVCRAAMG